MNELAKDFEDVLTPRVLVVSNKNYPTGAEQDSYRRKYPRKTVVFVDEQDLDL